MVDYKAEIVGNLSTILPTYYELVVDSTYAKPCITYIEGNNADLYDGDTVRFSNVEFTVKLWTNDVEDIVQYAPQIDSAMKEAGFTRTSSRELNIDYQICKIMNYRGVGFELQN